MSHHLTIRHETSEERTLLSVPHLAEVVAKVKQSRDIIEAMVSLCLRCQRNDNIQIKIKFFPFSTYLFIKF